MKNTRYSLWSALLIGATMAAWPAHAQETTLAEDLTAATNDAVALAGEATALAESTEELTEAEAALAASAGDIAEFVTEIATIAEEHAANPELPEIPEAAKEQLRDRFSQFCPLLINCDVSPNMWHHDGWGRLKDRVTF